MKTKFLMLLILSVSICSFGFAQSQTDTIKVWGNCEMCKSKIEKAAMNANAELANWDKKTKQLVVSYNASKTSNPDIQKKIALVGYDTQDLTATDAAYKKLAQCCQYKRSEDVGNRKEMNGINGSCCADMSCNKDCAVNNNTKDCCKTQFGKGYYYIGHSCTKLKKIAPTVVITANTNGQKTICCN